ncbi:hypothetical protein BFN03_08030 [Rhodococcus sp. WMMA185]|uniref:Zn-ribbon domain-containing OB-fold protein n=1 Tax=Rhodococcus sp. WMMA185 TaxID=679318 RepID=UPI000878C0E8|nr:OB-fold domain-containing protein [Rhodococcus sp. WMMA185]AOW92661.1 hypothetical protein BFN03_08030 [Rhodococcus sp. WMMA185]
MTAAGATHVQGAARTWELMIQRCSDCGTLLAPLMVTCPHCHGRRLERVPVSGRGSIVSSKVVHREVDGIGKDFVPCTIAIVELDEGPWVYTWIDGDVPNQPDRPVRVEYRPMSPEDQLPVFSIQSAFPR